MSYDKISNEEISEAADHDPKRALLMILANSVSIDAEKQATGEKLHEPKVHEAGWSISLETPKGVIGLWSCWLKNRFYLGYPNKTSFLIEKLSDDTILKVANRYRIENPKKFFFPPKEEFDLITSKRILSSFKDHELVDLLIKYGAPSIPHYIDETYLSDGLIMKTLGVELAKPVLQVSACAVNDENYSGQFKDEDKPLGRNKVGQILAYEETGQRLWAKFYGPMQPDNQGRVWIEYSDYDSNLHHFSRIIDSPSGIATDSFGHNISMGISTYSFSFYNEYAPEGPTADPSAIQQYKEKFLTLMCEIANRMGGATAVNIDYGFVLVPEQLEQLGYTDVSWLKGSEGTRTRYGEDIVRAKKGEETIILQSGNSLVPWSTIRRIPCAGLTFTRLNEFLTF